MNLMVDERWFVRCKDEIDLVETGADYFLLKGCRGARRGVILVIFPSRYAFPATLEPLLLGPAGMIRIVSHAHAL